MTRCKYCKKEIRWIKGYFGEYIACDPTAFEYWADPDGDKTFITPDGKRVTGTRTPVPGANPEIGFIPHAASCTAEPKVIYLQVKKKWFDMIRSGEKKEDYRAINDYWKERFQNAGLLTATGEPTNKRFEFRFKNGYAPDAPTLKVKGRLTIGRGKQEWGALCFTHYYIIQIEKVS